MAVGCGWERSVQQAKKKLVVYAEAQRFPSGIARLVLYLFVLALPDE